MIALINWRQDAETRAAVLECGERKQGDPVKSVLLCSLSEELTANRLVAALNDRDIPAVEMPRGAGHFLAPCVSPAYFDIDIFVPAHKENEAREILNAIRCEHG
jgi:hypothetical protein